MNRISRTLLATAVALSSAGALAQQIQQPSQTQSAQGPLTRAQVRRDLLDFSSRTSLPSEQPSLTRPQVRSELARQRELVLGRVRGRTGQMAQAEAGTRSLGYGTGSSQDSGLTRAEVRAEAARALRNGQIQYGEV